jgi:hypothetical protein
MTDERAGTLVVLACHCVYDPEKDAIYTDKAQFVNDRPVYEAHIDYAFRHLRLCENWLPDSDPLLVISGGFTKPQRRCSESRSYVELAKHMGLVIPNNLALEEFALTSIENLLLSLYVYHETRSVFPKAIDVISWEFKRERFLKTMKAISGWAPLGQSWDGLEYFPVGDLRIEERKFVLDTLERNYIESLQNEGLSGYYQNQETKAAITRRDVHDSRAQARERYGNYPLPF